MVISLSQGTLLPQNGQVGVIESGDVGKVPIKSLPGALTNTVVAKSLHQCAGLCAKNQVCNAFLWQPTSTNNNCQLAQVTHPRNKPGRVNWIICFKSYLAVLGCQGSLSDG